MDIEQFTQRQQALLPPWFGDAAPILQAVLQGSAYCNNFIYSLMFYLRAQMRLETMSGDTLDLFAQDYFGNKLLRHFGESDNPYRARISASLLRPGATRPAMVQVLTELTGRAPVIWESGIDSGFYNYSFYNHTSYGTQDDAYQAWIIAYRPVPPNFGGVSYYAQTGFYNNSFYQNLISANVTDQDILDAIQQTKCEGTLMHVTILD
jgi:hypothetical protein